MKELEKSLVSLGFSDKETGVYMGLLTIGRGTVSEIARRAHINRTTGYDILNTLVAKGLSSMSGKEPKQEYSAEAPEKILKLLEEKIRGETAALERAKEVVPRLAPLYQAGNRPRVRFYEGIEGLKEVYEDTLTSHEEIRAYANVEDMHKTLPAYFPRYYERRAKKGISIRAIIPNNEYGCERARHDSEEARDTALIPQKDYYFSPEINIYDNKVMIASWREKLGIIIESKEIAEAMKSMYELAWKEAQRVSKNA
jgi:sugar-specific transcriptional regulator TrmB